MIQNNKDILKDIPIKLKELKIKLGSKLTEILNAYLQSIEANKQGNKNLEFLQNQTSKIVNNRFSDVSQTQKRQWKNISQAFDSIQEEFIKLKAGLLSLSYFI